ncbi:MAG: nucleotidyl transferase AbiEii/AbiGii toxin family protein [bacterium]|nr:nucleotidyl transferase AbiEii/AbiGii toxin family protein [bacterium]
MITNAFLISKSNEQLIDKATILREYLQLVFLRNFYAQKFGSSLIYFKGGTAIRFLFNSFRFSEDLDFTCSGSFDAVEKILISAIPAIEKETRLKVVLKDRKAFESVGLGFRLVFTGELMRQPVGIRLDFSFREEPLDVESSIIDPHDYPIANFPVVTHYSAQEIVAEKIRACFARDKKRDFFDLWFLLKRGVPIDWEMIKKKMEYYPEILYSKDLLIRKIDALDPKILAGDLNSFLPQNYRQIYPKIIEELKIFVTESV